MTVTRIDMITRQRVRELAGKLMAEWQNPDAVADVLGCQRNAIRSWKGNAPNKGAENRDCAKEPGRPYKLTINQQTIIHDVILTKAPRDMNHPSALWSNAVVRDTIKDLFRVDVSLGTVNTMIHRMGIVRRQIFRPAPPPDNGDLSEWLKGRLPAIRKRARDQNARLFFVHDKKIDAPFSARTGACSGYAWDDPLDGGELRAIRVLSAICPRNSQRFMAFQGSLGARPLVAFLHGLMTDIDRPVFVIAQPHYKPIAMEADRFLSSVAERLSLFFLPKSLSASE